MKRIWDSSLNCLMAIDGEYECELSWCYKQIRNWKSLYFRKSTSIESMIKIRCFHPDAHEEFWKYYLELHRRGKMYSQQRICKEAYDQLLAEAIKELNFIHTGVDIDTLHVFTPTRVKKSL